MDDRQALQEYVQGGSQQAFRALVDRHVDLVWSAARRQLRDPSLADDATQAVFIILSRKARSLSPDLLLSSWLYKATRYVCRNALRQQARRTAHERKAAQMRTEAFVPAEDLRNHLAPLIDQAMASLATKDRNALLLRYFQKLSMKDVGDRLGVSEEAARKRISRGLERLEHHFRQQGINAPIAALDAGLLSWAVLAAPQAVHQSAAASIIAGASGAGASLVKGAMIMMSLKTTIVAASVAAIVLIGSTAAVVAVSATRPSSPAATARDSTKAAELTQDGWQMWQEATRLRAEGKFSLVTAKLALAQEKFARAVKLDPNLVSAWNGLGWCRWNLGNPDDAQKAFEKTIALEPGHAAAENGLGWIYFNRGQQDVAEQHWLTSAKTHNASAACSGLARMYLLQGKWDQAAEYAGKVVDSGDNSAKPLLDAAVAHSLPDDLRRQIAPPPPPTATDGDNQRGWQLLNQGQMAQAIGVFRSALAKNPTDANLHNGLGWALLRSGKAHEAKKEFEQALKLDPNPGGSMNGLAICLKQEGKTEQAMELWKKLDAAAGTSTNAGTYALARTYLELKQYDKAVAYFQRLAKENPADQEIRKGLEQAQAGAGL